MFGMKNHGRLARQRLERKLFMQPLERRQMLAADTFVNDNWFLSEDVDLSGTLTTGDVVDNRTDTGGSASVQATWGTTAFSDIEAAIAATDEGGTVTVLEGEYTADVEINKSVNLAGANAGISAGVDAGDRLGPTVINGGFQVSADNVTMDGFDINGGTDIGGDTAGVFLAAGASDVAIVNNVVTGAGDGRGILSTFNGNNDNLLIQGNEISGWTSGVFNQTNDNVDIVGNLIQDNVAGVANDFTSNVTIEGNDFKANAEAIGTFDSTDLLVTGNDLAENVVAIANYGGETVSATENYFGTVDPDEILDLVVGDVLAESPLAESPFDIEDVFDLVFTGPGGVSLSVDSETGDFEFDNGAGLVITGTGARIQNGQLKIHTHDAEGRKIDVKGDVDGSLDVSLKQLGKGTKKLSYSLTAEEAEEAVA